MSGEGSDTKVTPAVQLQRRTASDYDNLPYPSLPVSYCHPSSLAATVSLFNVSPPGVETARVLELGCASGGNLIPLAVQFPEATFVGIDISETQVKAANVRIAQLGLTNIRVSHGDLSAHEFGDGVFDYILCHGVFSWVPKPVQDAIFHICSKHLSPDGIAVISFNVLPGWHLRRVIRDICVLHAGTTGTAVQRANIAYQSLMDIAKVTSGRDLYGTLLRNEADRLSKMPISYLMGEFLSETNLPCHFNEFHMRARGAGLGYVCDAELPACLLDNLEAPIAESIRAKSRGSLGAAQQYVDLYTGRPFRRAVLVREGRQSTEIMPLDPEKLRGLHFAAELSPDRRPEAKGNPAFVDVRGRKLTPGDPRAHALLSRLAATFPSTLTLAELLQGQPESPEAEKLALAALAGMVARGQAAVFSTPLQVGRGEAAAPVAWPLSRIDAAANQPWITSQHHRAVRKIPALAVLLPLMDGTRSRAQLQSALETAIEKGELQMPPRSNGAAIQVPLAGRELAVAIGYAARNGLLLV